jgi:dihydropteroate synthase
MTAGRVWRLRTTEMPLGDRTLVMGILNVTPDSFSDGGRFASVAEAVAAAREMVASGADLVDVGGESTRPGAEPVSEWEELRRVIPVVTALADEGIVVSVDTSKTAVCAAAIEAGAEVINDVTALADPTMQRICAEAGVGVVLMHMRGRPRDMQDDPKYDDVVSEVGDELAAAASLAEATGVAPERIVVDPGLGFGKDFGHNLALLRSIPEVGRGRPVLIGHSRKRFIGTLTGIDDPAGRDQASAVVGALAVAGGADILRVHAVAPTVIAVRLADALVRLPHHKGR